MGQRLEVVAGIDLADEKQAIAVVGHDVRVLARKTVRVKAFRLGEALDWLLALAQARAKGASRVTVACEPTGPRWLQVQRLCAGRAVRLVCVQPLMSHIAGEQQDLTRHKSDESDCVLISRLAIGLRCCIPEELDETWAHLRHLAAQPDQAGCHSWIAAMLAASVTGEGSRRQSRSSVRRGRRRRSGAGQAAPG